ncbi:MULTISPECIES: hypothetical protein [Exiguobacterium]|uniref:Uncharacterized protein n=1 Tax=Exiguobacterium sibiricum (strain DSM 17290 / CCUG 55495 / CIP 109462 / JCM 13490 / 255-15) TaxID=262543 RepID=B1YG18_EXIS2|nr:MULTISPECIES: hypothetical protein [Exiguobacterium]ACB60945.1 hypothetical protein Exig_1485 [Exiguobacterium sibiricum 255-15]
MLTLTLINASSVILSDTALRLVLFGELLVLVLLYWAFARFSKRSLWIGGLLLVIGFAALIPGYLYVQNSNPQDAVIDVAILLYFPLELIALVLALLSLRKRPVRKAAK